MYYYCFDSKTNCIVDFHSGGAGLEATLAKVASENPADIFFCLEFPISL
jgi:hypothetical protein